MSHIPAADEVDAEWLTEKLHACGYTGEVIEVRSERVGSGQIGKCMRFSLTYAGEHDGPDTLVGKFPSDDPSSQATGIALRNYVREVRFYQQLQQRLPIRTPRCYFADIVDEGPTFCLLMEDLAPAQQGDQLLGCDADHAHAAVMQLVGLHAPGWNDKDLAALEWLGPKTPPAPGENPTLMLYQAQLPGFLDRFGPRLATEEAAIIEQVGSADTGPLFHRGEAEPSSLIHVDYRLDNLMFLPTEQGIEVTVMDWQSITSGPPLNDVAYFLGAGMLPAHRREVEESIVRDYHRGLIDAGIADFSWEDCWLRYRQGTFAGFGVTVIASMIVEQTARGDEMFTAMAQRHARHALDMNAGEFLQ